MEAQNSPLRGFEPRPLPGPLATGSKPQEAPKWNAIDMNSTGRRP